MINPTSIMQAIDVEAIYWATQLGRAERDVQDLKPDTLIGIKSAVFASQRVAAERVQIMRIIAEAVTGEEHARDDLLDLARQARNAKMRPIVLHTDEQRAFLESVATVAESFLKFGK